MSKRHAPLPSIGEQVAAWWSKDEYRLFHVVEIVSSRKFNAVLVHGSDRRVYDVCIEETLPMEEWELIQATKGVA